MYNHTFTPHPETAMKFCYCDETGTGSEPIAAMVGIVVDAVRMKTTKEEWKELLAELTVVAGKHIVELHAKDFFPGRGIWHGVRNREEIATRIIDWLVKRKHRIVYCAVLKRKYRESYAALKIDDGLNTEWRFLGFHLVLAMQSFGQKFKNNKGHTIFIFDNKYREELRFRDLILHPPDWSDAYYDRKSTQCKLDQVVDVPYFGDSRDVGLIQIADFVAYLVRRYAELNEGCGKPPYNGEMERVGPWIRALAKCSIGRSLIYPKVKRSEAAEIFYSHAPESLRMLEYQ